MRFNVENERCNFAMEIYKVAIVRLNTGIKRCNVANEIYKCAIEINSCKCEVYSCNWNKHLQLWDIKSQLLDQFVIVQYLKLQLNYIKLMWDLTLKYFNIKLRVL